VPGCRTSPWRKGRISFLEKLIHWINLLIFSASLLESILGNRFGRNLLIKPILVRFNFVIVAFGGFKIPENIYK
jgi:hypothetical protein